MKYKNILLFFLTLVASLLFSNKIEAANISYCSYNDIKLTLPVYIKVEINGVDSTYPFDTQKNYHYSDSLFVYNSSTCNASLTLPYIENKNGMNIIRNGYSSYYVSLNYYYSYNDVWYKSEVPLMHGVFTNIDTTKPTISSTTPNIVVSMETLLSLDTVHNYITAHDDSDGNLEVEMIYDNYTENYNQPGTYHIIYKACDYSNNCNSYSQKITVIDNIRPVISGKTSITSYMSNPLTLFQIANSLTAMDNLDGDISSSIYPIDSYYNINNPGTYYILFDVKDSSNNNLLTPFKVTINYLDDIAPSVEGPTVFNSYLSSILETKFILDNLIVSDNIDNNIKDNLYIFSDNYSINKTKVGTYKIIVSCYDNSGNNSTPYILEINVIDDIKPVIEGNKIYTTYLSNPITINELKNKLISIDNHDGNITHKINIHENNYSSNTDKIGVYYISFIVNDDSNNISDIFKIEITLIDDVLPTIDGVNYYNVLTSEKISITSITNSLNAIDNVDGDISYNLVLNENDYSDNYIIPGTYYLSYYVCDKSGNISLPFKIKIDVKESLTYIKSINHSLLYFDNTHLISDDEILKILNIKKDDYLNISTITNNYKTNYTTPGDYKITYQIENPDYTKEYLNIKIHIYSSKENTTSENNKTKKKETLLFYIVSFFKNFFMSLPIFP